MRSFVPVGPRPGRTRWRNDQAMAGRAYMAAIDAVLSKVELARRVAALTGLRISTVEGTQRPQRGRPPYRFQPAGGNRLRDAARLHRPAVGERRLDEGVLLGVALDGADVGCCCRRSHSAVRDATTAGALPRRPPQCPRSRRRWPKPPAAPSRVADQFRTSGRRARPHRDGRRPGRRGRSCRRSPSPRRASPRAPISARGEARRGEGERRHDRPRRPGRRPSR